MHVTLEQDPSDNLAGPSLLLPDLLAVYSEPWVVGLHSTDPISGEPRPTQQHLAGDSYKWVAHDCELNNVGPGGAVGPRWLRVAADEQPRSKIARLTATGGHRMFQHRTAYREAASGCLLLPLHGGSPLGITAPPPGLPSGTPGSRATAGPRSTRGREACHRKHIPRTRAAACVSCLANKENEEEEEEEEEEEDKRGSPDGLMQVQVCYSHRL
ncbi:hypothetical protein MUK42_17897 [Musa troglodytarum]|uniref:Uncharacterized protein n=1 Tax=Musa troglodytarum TaxID=320322 RepID=A0A9E7GU45_9LILI|nr:hypothetical protein MUK42_17897 [Musa troglodytarum]